MARLFLALWPDDQLRHQLAQWRDGWDWPKPATPVKTERLHVTLHFLGEVERDRLPALMAALHVPYEPFSLQFGRNEKWHRGLAVLEPVTVPAALTALHAALSGALTDAGLTVEARPYRPHVTLARRADKAAPRTSGPAIDWQVDSYALMESTPQEGYTVLREWRHGAPG